MTEQAYLDMLSHIMKNGVVKTDRTGTGTKSLFGKQLRFDMANGFPLMTTKRVHFKSVVVELLWFLSGSTNIKPLVDQNVTIWSEWPAKKFNQWRTSQGLGVISVASFNDLVKQNIDDFANKWGELGPVYGYQWRHWPGPELHGKMPDKNSGIKQFSLTGPSSQYKYKTHIDQITQSIDMLKKSPDSRRNIVSAWNVADIDEMAVSGLPPCHFAFQWNTRPMTLEEGIDYWNNNKHDLMISYEREVRLGLNEKEVSELINEPDSSVVGPLVKTANLDALNIPSRKLDCHVNIRSY